MSGVLTSLVERVADLLDVEPGAIDPDAPHASYGLDSASALMLAAELEDELGVHFADSLAWDHPTLRSLAEHIESLGLDAPAAGASGAHGPDVDASSPGGVS